MIQRTGRAGQSRNEWERQRVERVDEARKAGMAQHAGQSRLRVLLRFLQKLFDIRIEFRLLLLLLLVLLLFSLAFLVVVVVLAPGLLLLLLLVRAGRGRTGGGRGGSGCGGIFRFIFVLLEDPGRYDAGLAEPQELLQNQRLLVPPANAPHFNRPSLDILDKNKNESS